MSLEQEYVGSVGAVTYSGTVGYGGEPPTWGEVLDKPSTFAPSAHRHNLSDINNIDSKQDNIIAGRNIYISSDGKTINALDASSAAAGETTWSNVLGKPDVVENLQYTVNPNLLDNWYFAKPVNQRGQTSYNGSGYTIDRWMTWDSESVVSISGGHITAPKGLYQYLKIPSGQLTASVLFADGVFRAATTSNDDGGYWGADLIIWFNRSQTDQFVLVKDPDNAHGGVVAVKLELGTQQTLAHLENGTWVLNEIPKYVDERIRCMHMNDDGSWKD